MNTQVKYFQIQFLVTFNVTFWKYNTHSVAHIWNIFKNLLKDLIKYNRSEKCDIIQQVVLSRGCFSTMASRNPLHNYQVVVRSNLCRVSFRFKRLKSPSVTVFFVYIDLFHSTRNVKYHGEMSRNKITLKTK